MSSPYLVVLNEFLLFLEIELKLWKLKRFLRKSTHLEKGILCESNMVLEMTVKLLPHSLHLYFCSPLGDLPFLTMREDPQNLCAV
jgi:hypothetical protein